jgi:DNA-binding CsgD family transcriptional regulator
LAELLQDRLDSLSPEARDARDVLALGEPLPYDTLAAVVSEEAIMELDGAGLVSSDAAGGVVRLRFSHPLLHAAAARRLSAARRRGLARRLILAPAHDVDLLRRAAWQEAAGGRPDVDLLVRAARSLIVIDPAQAVRFAERAVHHDDGPDAAVMLADARAELGEAELARAALGIARERVRNNDDRWTVAISEASLALWSFRQPLAAIEVVEQFSGALPGGPGDDQRSVTALLTLFSSNPEAAGRLADEVLAGSPEPSARRRCLLVRVVAAMLRDQPEEAREASALLAAVLSRYPQPESARSMATAIAGTAGIFGFRSSNLPRAGGGTGRWPSPDRSMAAADGRSAPDIGESLSPGPVWPLLDGVRRHLAGDLAGAAVALREATVQQLQGEGLFLSEATGGLIVVLAETGQFTQARQVLDAHGPDATAVIPGMRGWAEAWLLAGAGRDRDAGELLVQTAAETASVGAVTTAFWYLADAARLGATRLAADRAESLADRVHSALTAARLDGIRARALDRAEPLVVAAEAHQRMGLFGHAAELAQRCLEHAARPGTRVAEGVGRRARAVVAAAHADLGLPATPGSPSLPQQLTRRENEISRLAAKGLRDKDIADELVVSVRTVESHLATAYRKLGISSRGELAQVLGRPGSPR